MQQGLTDGGPLWCGVGITPSFIAYNGSIDDGVYMARDKDGASSPQNMKYIQHALFLAHLFA